MKKILCFLFVLSGCTFVKNKSIDCNNFDVNINTKLYTNPVFLVNLKREITHKLNPLKNENSSNICYIDVNVRNISHSSLTNVEGATSRENINTKVAFSLKINNNIVIQNSFISFFFGKSKEGSRYSNYKNEQKIEDDLVENIANEIYKDIITNL